MNKSYLSV